MTPTYRINSPDVLATLPRPLDHSKGQYHTGEVYTQLAGSKKRKRLEVAVGVDGEAANIYHVPSSDLRTSYPIPPQESFTSPPYSIRYQNPASTDREQYTYFSTQNGAESKITLCKDSIRSTGRTASTSKSHRVHHKSPVQRLCTTNNLQVTSDDAPYGDLLAVCKDGQFLCLEGASLDEKWSASTFSLCRDILPPSASSLSVDEVFHITAEEALKGVFQDRQDAFGAFGSTVDPATFNPDVFILVTSVFGAGAVSPFLVILGAAPGSQNLVQLHVTPLPSQKTSTPDLRCHYQLHVRSARLLELSDNTIRTYDLSSAVPKLRDTVMVPEGSGSFVQLSEHSVLSASPASLTVTNVTYRSVQAQVATPADEASEGAPPDQGLTLLTYFSKLDLVIAVANNILYSVQVQRQKSHSKEGLLIDAIGCGLSKAEHLPEHSAPRPRPPFNRLLPGTLSDHYVKQSLADVENLDTALSHGNLKEFEKLLAAKFQVTVESSGDDAAASDDAVTPDWQWLSASFYPFVDRRWVLYAISRVFSIEFGDDDAGRPTLDCILPESNVLVYLVVAGHLTVSNVLAAFRSELSDVKISRNVLAEGIVQQLIDVDPALELLLNYLLATKLGEVELLLIIRTIMRSLDQQPRLALEKKPIVSEEEDDYVAMEIDQLERELEKAEYNLGDESNTRARLLTAAFEKLAGFSSVATVRAMRVTLSPLEILSLIHLLRIQLVGSAWTTRYSEITGLDTDESVKTMPDGAIALIAELLARCIDAVGTNGWLTSGSASDQLDGGHFLTALKLEVNAALEGLNDVVVLNGILGEAVRFGTASLSNGRAAARTGDRPRQMELAGSAELPLGLAPKQAVSQYKVISGGEVVERSAREKGHLLSQRVKEYSLERISI